MVDPDVLFARWIEGYLEARALLAVQFEFADFLPADALTHPDSQEVLLATGSKLAEFVRGALYDQLEHGRKIIIEKHHESFPKGKKKSPCTVTSRFVFETKHMDDDDFALCAPTIIDAVTDLVFEQEAIWDQVYDMLETVFEDTDDEDISP